MRSHLTPTCDPGNFGELLGREVKLNRACCSTFSPQFTLSSRVHFQISTTVTRDVFSNFFHPLQTRQTAILSTLNLPLIVLQSQTKLMRVVDSFEQDMSALWEGNCQHQ